ncbi:MAG: hypothetical protein KC656_28050 [Myxococcales bacterium]|nr:hypothetical protein [Myxococcales bacterium]
MTHEHTETIEVRGGRGELSLRHGRVDTALLYEGEPVAMVWSPHGAGHGRTFVRAQDLGTLEEAHLLRHVGPGARLSAILRPVLARLEDGRYHLELLPSPELEPDDGETSEAVPASGRFVDWAGLHEVADDEPLLIGTVPRDLLDRTLIEDLARWIRDGGRPAVVVLDCEADDVGFLVAGHAVLEAYRLADRAPTVLRITAVSARHLPLREGADLLTRAYERIGHIVAAHYAATAGEAEKATA